MGTPVLHLLHVPSEALSPLTSPTLLCVYSYNNSITWMEMRCQNAPGFSDLPNFAQKALAGYCLLKPACPQATGYVVSTSRDS